jgi:hypothetical protein
MWQTVIGIWIWSARAANSFLRNRSRYPLEPPASVVLGLGSERTEWVMPHRHCTEMVRPGRELLDERVVVDELLSAQRNPALGGGCAGAGL